MTEPADLATVTAWLNEQRLSTPHELHRRLTTMETLMSEVDDKLAAITANLDNIAADIQRLNDLATALQTELADLDPALAAKLQPLVDLSQQIADATPEPTPEPPPVP